MTWARSVAGAMILVFGASSQVASQTDELEVIYKATNNIAHEYTQCAAYFLVVSVALENSDKPELALQYEAVSNTALEYGAGFAEMAGLLPETTTARYESEFIAMSERIAGNTSNISILSRDYATPCKTAMEDMDGRVDYWMDNEWVIR